MSRTKIHTTTRRQRRKPIRDEKGRFARVWLPITPENAADAISTLYEWRDLRRQHDMQRAAMKHENRFSAARSFGIFLLMSSALVGLLLTNLG